MLDEPRRHDLIAAFIDSHGRDTAMDLADAIFSTEPATKEDLKAALEPYATKQELATGLAELKAEIRGAMNSQTRWLVGTMFVLFGLSATVG